jgi:hypothetical protein
MKGDPRRRQHHYRIAMAIALLLESVMLGAITFRVLSAPRQKGEEQAPHGLAGPPAAAAPARCGEQSDGAQQCIFQVEVRNGRKQITLGVLNYDPVPDMDVGDTKEYTVSICGRSVQRCGFSVDNAAVPLGPPSTKNNAAVPLGPSSTKNIPMQIGGNIRATMNSDMPGQITPLSARDQPVTEATDMASWTWRISPTKAGNYKLTLIFAMLLGESQDVLLTPEKRLTIDLSASETPSNAIHIGLNTAKDTTVLISSVVGAFGFSVAGILLWPWRRRKKKPFPEPGRLENPAISPPER